MQITREQSERSGAVTYRALARHRLSGGTRGVTYWTTRAEADEYAGDYASPYRIGGLGVGWDDEVTPMFGSLPLSECEAEAAEHDLCPVAVTP